MAISNQDLPLAVGQIRHLVDELTRISVDQIPQNALSRAALCIADCITVGLSTAEEPEIVKFRKYVQSRASRNESTIFCAPVVQAEKEWAAVVNALSMTTSEMDGGYDKTACHAALYTVPTLVAISEANNVNILATLRAEVLAYELVTRIARAWAPRNGQFPALYTHSRFCAIGSAAAAAFAMDMSNDSIVRTINMATTMISVGPRNHLMEGALVRNLWPASATWNGLMSAQWASCGFDGLSSSVYDVFTGVLGFPFDANALTKDIGKDWAISDSYVRIYACHLFFNTLVECLMDIRPKLVSKASLKDIESVIVLTHPEALDLIDKSPNNSLQARFSIPHVVAAILTTGDASPTAFSSRTLKDPFIVELRNKVQVGSFEMSNSHRHKWPAAVKVIAKGEEFSAQHSTARGGHGEPYTKDDLLRKISKMTKPHYPHFLEVFSDLAGLNANYLRSNTSEIIRRAVTS